MSDKVMKSFEIGRMNPFQFRFVVVSQVYIYSYDSHGPTYTFLTKLQNP